VRLVTLLWRKRRRIVVDRSGRPNYRQIRCLDAERITLEKMMTVATLVAALLICMFVFMAMDEKSY
jgi:hypothetical protein